MKRSNGYNVDDFVASSEEDVSVTDESPSSGSDSDDSEFEG